MTLVFILLRKQKKIIRKKNLYATYHHPSHFFPCFSLLIWVYCLLLSKTNAFADAFYLISSHLNLAHCFSNNHSLSIGSFLPAHNHASIVSLQKFTKQISLLSSYSLPATIHIFHAFIYSNFPLKTCILEVFTSSAALNSFQSVLYLALTPNCFVRINNHHDLDKLYLALVSLDTAIQLTQMISIPLCHTSFTSPPGKKHPLFSLSLDAFQFFLYLFTVDPS